MNRNIFLAYILASLRFSWFWLGIWIFYYLRFTNYAGIGLAESVMILTAVTMEIPTGVIADLLGKKFTLFMAFLLQVMGNILMGISPSFSLLVFGIFVATLGGTLYSGTIDSLLYDTLKQVGTQEKFGKIMANITSLQNITAALAGIIGGYLYTFSPSLPFFATAAAYFLAVIASLFLIEPIKENVAPKISDFFEHTKQGFKLLFANNIIARQTLILLTLGFVFVITREMLDDLLAVEFGYKAQQLSILWACVYLSSALIIQIAPKFQKIFPGLKSVFVVAAIVCATFLISPFVGVVVGTISIVTRIFFEAIFENNCSVIINNSIGSKYRTTTISTFNMMRNIPYAFLAFFLGSTMDLIHAKNFAFILGIIILLFIGVNIFIKRSRILQMVSQKGFLDNNKR